MELMAPAKINLFLRVIGRRADGYHALQSLMCGVALYDRLRVRFGGESHAIHCTCPGVPCDGNNLVLKAVALFNRALASDTHCIPRNVAIELIKEIPVGAGLGGGSSDAAAMLTGLNAHYGLPFDSHRLKTMALTLGADVPFFVEGRPAMATGIGETLMPYHGLPAWHVVLVYPGFALATSQVYKNLNLGLTKSKKKLRYFPFNNGEFSATHHLLNDLEAGVGDHFPVIENIKAALIRMGALGALMTGSGSAVFGLFEDMADALEAKAALDQVDGWQVFASRLLT